MRCARCGNKWHAMPTGAALLNHDVRDRYYQLIDAANQALIGTTVGIAASVLFILTGLYVLTRRT